MLRMHTMRFADELVDPDTLDRPALGRKPDTRMRRWPRARRRAVGRIPARPLPRHVPRPRARPRERKAKGEEIDTERAQAPEPTDDLMAALEASLKGSKH